MGAVIIVHGFRPETVISAKQHIIGKDTSRGAEWRIFQLPRIFQHCSRVKKKKKIGSGGIRTHAIEMTGALNQRLRPLGHATTHTTTPQLPAAIVDPPDISRRVGHLSEREETVGGS